MKQWAVYDLEDEVHVLPEDDLVGHEQSHLCVCRPTAIPVDCEDGSIGLLYRHYSLDNREASERRRREAD